ncbi:MAG: redoxin domain-containing protein [Erysipelotrichaceae bacterium]|nr:redoxin domain-containing protein [Erysipelotrichaceae bacterium]
MDYKLLGGIFLEGVLSFLSPCVLPLIPLYMSYLAGDNCETDENGTVHYKTGKVFITTLFFILGICFSFVLLSLSLNALSSFLEKYKEVISAIGGTLLIIFGLHECGIIHIDFLEKELKLKVDLKLDKMNFLKAFMLGFVFSLGWSPCIGPMLANALLIAATSSSGYVYIIAYALGLIIPFLLAGLFTSSVLNFINRKKDIMKWVLKIAGIIMIIFGGYMIFNASKMITAAKSIEQINTNENSSSEMDIEKYLTDYKFTDVDGNTVVLSDYKGKYVFLNFTTTWCTYCKMEMPDFISFAENEDVVCLYVMSPYEETGGRSDIERFVKDNDIPLTTIVDEEGLLFYYCGVNSYPTTFVIDPDSSFQTYVSGALNLEYFNKLLEYVRERYEAK